MRQKTTPFSGAFNFFISLFLLLINAGSMAQQMPETPKKLIENSISNWNRIYGVSVRAINWLYEGVINDDAKKKQVVDEITNTQNAWMPDGDVNKPAEVTAIKVADVPGISRAAISDWSAKTKQKIALGQHLARIKWMKGNQSFTTLCVTDDHAFIYDNMISNILVIDHHSRCLAYRMGWLWQTSYADMTRGEITADLIISCNGEIPTCDHKCDAWMTAGDAKIICSVKTVGNCCQLSWAYGWACGFKSVKIKAKGISVEIEGYLGSSGTGSGSCTECCPKTVSPVSNVAPRVQTAGALAGTEGPLKVRTISVTTISGDVIEVKVPNNIRPGDQISGSVVIKNNSTLTGAVVDVQGKKSNVSDKFIKIAVPMAAAAVIPLFIKDKASAIIGTANIPVNLPSIPFPSNMPPPVTTPPGNFAGVNYCQPGEPYTINGNFDGNLSNTRVLINDIPCQQITEGPRGSSVEVPASLTAGPATVKVKEGNVEESYPIQVINVNLSATITNITKGTYSDVTVTASGLKNLKLAENNFKMTLENKSPATIQFKNEPGNTITRPITESDVNNGVYTFNTRVTGTAAGPFTLNSNVSSATCTECWEQYQHCLARVSAAEEKCYKDCDKANEGTACYLACSVEARAKETECFAAYIGCMKKKLGY